jgi:hypothetical protein
MLVCHFVALPEFAPFSLNMIGVNTSSVTLHWLSVINATNITAQYYTYNVLMTSPTLPNQTSVTNLTDSGGQGQNLTVDNLNASTTYSFVIVPYRVIDGVWNEGLSSNTVNVTTNSTIPGPVPMPGRGNKKSSSLLKFVNKLYVRKAGIGARLYPLILHDCIKQLLPLCCAT